MQTSPYQCSFKLDIIYPGESVSADAAACVIDRDITFDAENLQSYVPSGWDPLIFDVMILAAAVEACDYSRKRANMDWGRDFTASLPVHNLERWSDPNIKKTLERALKLLTGDDWNFSFRPTPERREVTVQGNLDFPPAVDVVIPFSDGLDSRAVAGVLEKSRKQRSIRVRVGADRIKKPKRDEPIIPFANVPFKVAKIAGRNGESSGRSRGFKFSLMSGLAAYLVGADTVIVPESGQGALGPVLVNTGQTYPDRRTHPQFTYKMSDFFEALFGRRILFEHPVLWQTKGQSLSAYKKIYADDLIWKGTRSCWADARHASVNKEHRQCGVCAACILRRTSLHAAGYNEPSDYYVWENLGAEDFWEGAHKDYATRHDIRRQYAIAGILHMNHLAARRNDPDLDSIVQRQAVQLAPVLDQDFDDICTKIRQLIDAHAGEWSHFVNDLPNGSFVRKWAEAA